MHEQDLDGRGPRAAGTRNHSRRAVLDRGERGGARPVHTRSGQPSSGDRVRLDLVGQRERSVPTGDIATRAAHGTDDQVERHDGHGDRESVLAVQNGGAGEGDRRPRQPERPPEAKDLAGGHPRAAADLLEREALPYEILEPAPGCRRCAARSLEVRGPAIEKRAIDEILHHERVDEAERQNRFLSRSYGEHQIRARSRRGHARSNVRQRRRTGRRGSAQLPPDLALPHRMAVRFEQLVAEAHDEVRVGQVGGRSACRAGHVLPGCAPTLVAALQKEIRTAVSAQDTLQPESRQRCIPAFENGESFGPPFLTELPQRCRDLFERFVPGDGGPPTRAPRPLAAHRAAQAVRMHEPLQTGESGRAQAARADRVVAIALETHRQAIDEPDTDSAPSRAEATQGRDPSLDAGAVRGLQAPLLHHRPQPVGQPAAAGSREARRGHRGHELASTQFGRHGVQRKQLIGDNSSNPRPRWGCDSFDGNRCRSSSRDALQTDSRPPEKARSAAPRPRGTPCS